MSLLIANAVAATGGPANAGADGSFSLLMIVGIFVLFYLMLVRPQAKRAKAHRALVDSVKAGDEIVTSSGMLATVVSLDEQYLKAEIAQDVTVTLQRGAISTILPKGSLKTL